MFLREILNKKIVNMGQGLYSQDFSITIYFITFIVENWGSQNVLKETSYIENSKYGPGFVFTRLLDNYLFHNFLCRRLRFTKCS